MDNYKGKRIFISHPLSDDPIGNKESADRICKYMVRQGLFPISPLHMFSFHENDDSREEILEICFRLIDLCDGVFVFGDSDGCNAERSYAIANGKPVEVLFHEDN